MCRYFHFFASPACPPRSLIRMAKRYDNPLENLKVASPCSQDWDQMAGDDRKRYCGECSLHVYNLSGMTRYDAENLLRLSEGRLCIRYFQRPDGTILTKDCPVGWAAVKRRVSLAAAAAFGLFISVVGTIGVMSVFGRKIDIGRQIPWVKPTPEPHIMGAIAMPSPTPRVSPTPKRDQKMGKYLPKPKIDEELRQRVLRGAGA